jgi:hypothetical protein
MEKLHLTRNKFLPRVFMFIMMSVVIIFFGVSIRVDSADITQRSVEIGSSVAGETTNHDFTYLTNTSSNIGSVVYEYCSNSPFIGSPCTVPVGLDVSGAGILTQTGITGVSVDASTTSNRLVLTRASTLINPTTVRHNFSNIINQTTVNESVYVRITSHVSADGTGLPVDSGAVVYSTVAGIGIGGYVPPYLTFCVGVTVELDCSVSSGSLLSFGELSNFSPRTVTSQFVAYTNDPTGYTTFISGSTLTSGNNIINAMTTNSASIPGANQFGINLRANANPAVGANVSGGGSSLPRPNYNISNVFRFINGEQIAGTNFPTLPNRFTVSYIVNVIEDQPPGIYSTTLVYIAVASF